MVIYQIKDILMLLYMYYCWNAPIILFMPIELLNIARDLLYKAIINLIVSLLSLIQKSISKLLKLLTLPPNDSRNLKAY